MKYEYLLLLVMIVMAWQNFVIGRQLKRLWQAVDKTKYINRYLEILAETKDQVRAIKALRQEFKELNLMQAYEVSQLIHKS